MKSCIKWLLGHSDDSVKSGTDTTDKAAKPVGPLEYFPLPEGKTKMWKTYGFPIGKTSRNA